MKPTPFSLDNLAKSKAPAKTKAKPAESFKPTTPWGREFLKRLDKLHKALDGKKLA